MACMWPDRSRTQINIINKQTNLCRDAKALQEKIAKKQAAAAAGGESGGGNGNGNGKGGGAKPGGKYTSPFIK